MATSGRLNILVLEGYDSGSHGQFLDGLIGHSRHRFSRIGLPARKWKWRMRGSAIYFAEQIARGLPEHTLDADDIDLVFTSDMTAVADLKALLGKSLPHKPIVCYFHENQLTYPLQDESQRDYQYGFTNITSCLAADAVWFNSRYHLESFIAAADSLLRRMPDFVPRQVVATIRHKAGVMPLGLDEKLLQLGQARRADHPPTARTCRRPVTILWNHRWEYDKNPEEFFAVLCDLQKENVPFSLIVAGENFREAPPVFETARDELADNIDHFGNVRDRGEYLELLRRADVVVSTAHHEFFGVSVLEAIAAGCFALLPKRLSYPELIPNEVHHKYLYSDRRELRAKLQRLCRTGVRPPSDALAEAVASLAWPRIIARYDDGFDRIRRWRHRR